MMEIEKENIAPPQEAISSSNPNITSLTSMTISKINYLSQILGIKINPDELSLFTDIESISSLINSIKFPEKKKNETKETIIEDLQALNSEESIKKINEEKSKKFYEVVKINGKTTMYSTAEKDELSPTMHAFYFCDKSKQVFSDKEAAEYKIMTCNPVCPMFIKDEDNSSYNSNMNEIQGENNNNKILSKKRKGSNNFNNKQKQSKKKKIEKNNNIIEEHANNSKNGSDVLDADYCTDKCKYGRKMKNQNMIQCDDCKIWYHSKCVGVSPEEFQTFVGNGKKYYCPRCEGHDNESKQNSESGF